MRILSILGQKPGLTGSGVLLKELWECARNFGDDQQVILAAYPSDNYHTMFDGNYIPITYSYESEVGELPFPILGMSDIMPYPTIQYSKANIHEIQSHIEAFQRRMQEVILTFKPHIIHIHHLWILVSLANHSFNTPTFVTVHGTDLKQLKAAPHYRRFVNSGIDKISRFLCVSTDILSEAKKVYNLPSHKTLLIGNGFNETIFSPYGEKINCDKKLIICAGKYVRWKGFRFAIRACASLSFPYLLVILGSGNHEERISLMQEASRNNVEENILLTGHVSQDELARWFRRADVFLLPSIHEPFGLVLLEALACGCPAIASASGGPKDIILEELIVNGYATLVDELDQENKLDEVRYVSHFSEALKKHLSRQYSMQEREKIAASVKGREWKNVYQLVRTEYEKFIV